MYQSTPLRAAWLSLELYQEPLNSKVHQFDITFFGGDSNAPPVNLSYLTQMHLFEASVQYSANKHIIDPSSAIALIDKNTNLDLSAYLDSDVREDTVWQVANLLRLVAKEASPPTYTSSERHTYITQQGTNIELIATEQNGHTMQYILDLHTRVAEQDGATFMKALNFRSTIDSHTKPYTSLTTYEVTASGVTVSQADVDHLATLSPDEAHTMLSHALVTMHPIE